MAKINTSRPEAMAYQGMTGTFVRDVIDNEPAYDGNVDQVVVNINGNDLYFYASEVDLSDGEKKQAEKTHAEVERNAAQMRADRDERMQGKAKWLAGFKRGSDVNPMEDAQTSGGGGIAPMDIPAHAQSTPQQVVQGTSPFNRVPGEPARTAEQDGAVQETGPGGYPEGSGPDPQGRREGPKDQSKSNPSERPVPGTGAKPQK